MSKLYILRGVPGSGKSTYGKKIVDDAIDSGLSGIKFEADDFFMKDGKYNWNPKFIGMAHKWCQNSVRKALDAYDVVVVANTNLGLTDVNPYIKIANDALADFEVVAIHGNHQNVHNVPEETLEKMRAKMVDFPGSQICHFLQALIFRYSLREHVLFHRRFCRGQETDDRLCRRVQMRSVRGR